MNVLSLFDGMSCGRIALDKLGIQVDNYFASEVDKYAIKVSKENYPDIIQLGDITQWKTWDLPKIDLIIGGSPCQGFSFAGKQLAFDDPRSKLFFEFLEIYRCIRCYNPKVKFLLENVKMKKDNLNIITDFMGVEPVFINSNLVSAQNRQRYYWCNWEVEQPEDRGILLKDVIEQEVDESFYHTKNAIAYMERDTKGWMKKGSCRADKFTQSADNEKSFTITASFRNGVPHNYFKCGAMRGRYIVDGKRADHTVDSMAGKTEQRIEIRSDNKTNALTTVQKDNLIVTSYNRNDGPGKELEKAYPLNASDWRGLNRNQNQNAVVNKGSYIDKDERLAYRKLTPLECERLQTVPDNYTNYVSNTQRYKMLGNGFTVDVIAHILSQCYE